MTTYHLLQRRLPRGRCPRRYGLLRDGAIEVNWEPQAGQVPASATIAAHLQADRYDEAIPLLRTRLQLEPDHLESLTNLDMVGSDQMGLKEARELLGRAVP